MKITIDKQAFCIVIDKTKNKPLGSGFSFLKDNWVITAKHVVLDNGIPRDKLELSFLERENIEAKVAAVHPTLDIAILEYDGESKCKRPLMPGYLGLNGSNILFMTGYSPTSSNGTDLAFRVDCIENFEVEIRERDQDEITLHFKAEFCEGGNSGGAIIGEGGNVIGVIIESYFRDDKKYCVATSIESVMKDIVLIQTRDTSGN